MPLWVKDQGVWKLIGGGDSRRRPTSGEIEYFLVGGGSCGLMQENSQVCEYAVGGGAGEVLNGIIVYEKNNPYVATICGNYQIDDRGDMFSGAPVSFSNITARGGWNIRNWDYDYNPVPSGSPIPGTDGSQIYSPGKQIGGGGAGARENGGDVGSGGKGGDGITDEILDAIQHGQLVDGHYWVAGGGGGFYGKGGKGGGGDGTTDVLSAAVGIPGTGSGGGAGTLNYPGTNTRISHSGGPLGGSGVVILRMLASDPEPIQTGFTISVVGDYRYYKLLYNEPGVNPSQTTGTIEFKDTPPTPFDGKPYRMDGRGTPYNCYASVDDPNANFWPPNQSDFPLPNWAWWPQAGITLPFPYGGYYEQWYLLVETDDPATYIRMCTEVLDLPSTTPLWNRFTGFVLYKRDGTEIYRAAKSDGYDRNVPGTDYRITLFPCEAPIYDGDGYADFYFTD